MDDHLVGCAVYKWSKGFRDCGRVFRPAIEIVCRAGMGSVPSTSSESQSTAEYLRSEESFVAIVAGWSRIQAGPHLQRQVTDAGALGPSGTPPGLQNKKMDWQMLHCKERRTSVGTIDTRQRQWRIDGPKERSCYTKWVWGKRGIGHVRKCELGVEKDELDEKQTLAISNCPGVAASARSGRERATHCRYAPCRRSRIVKRILSG